MWSKKSATNAGKLQSIPESVTGPVHLLGNTTIESKYQATSTPTKAKACTVLTSSPGSDSTTGNQSFGYTSMNSSQGTPQKVHSSAKAPKQHIELFVKSGRDGRSCGACPICQQIFMILLVKAQVGSLTFTVTTVNSSKPPAEFKDLSNRLPTLIHAHEVLKDTDEMVEYVEKKFPVPCLAPEYNGSQASEICADLISKLAYFLKDVSGSSTQLVAELRRIDDFLASQNSRFLCGDRLSLLDCVVLPKLQHIRVASKAFKQFELPHSLVYLWRYLMFAYNNEVFKKTCPCDQEIVYHWFHKSVSDNQNQMHHSGITLQQLMTSALPDRHSWDIPKDIKIPPLL